MNMNTLNTTILLTHYIIRHVIVWSGINVGCQCTHGLGEVHVVEYSDAGWTVVLFDFMRRRSSAKKCIHTRNEIHDVTPINFVFSSFNRVMLFDSLKEVYSKVHCDSILYVNPHNIGIIQPIISLNRNSPT